MSAKKIEALAKRASENQKKADQLRDEVEKLKVQMDAYEAEAERAAESGDVDSYKELKQKAADANAIVYVKQANIKKLSFPCTEEEARTAWAEFQREYDVMFTKALKEYDAEVKKQRERFKNIIAMQNNARDQRRILAKLSGLPDDRALKAFKFECVDGIGTDGPGMGHDRVFYLNKKEITSDESLQIMDSFMCQSRM